MPINLSALKKTEPKKDLGEIFGETSKVNTSSLTVREPVGEVIERAPEPTFFEKAKELIPTTIKEGLFGRGQEVDIAGRLTFDTGILGFFRPFGIGKPVEQKASERIDLLNPLIQEGKITQDRANEIIKDVVAPEGIKAIQLGAPIQKPELNLTAEEKRALRPIVIEETLDKVFGALDVVSLGTIKPIEKTIAQKIAKSKSVNKIADLLSGSLPEMSDDAVDVFSQALREIDNADDVQRVLNKTELAIQEAQKTAPKVKTEALAPVEDLTAESEILRGTKGMTADDIMKTYPNIKLTRDLPAKDIHGNKVEIPDGEVLTPYELKGNKVLLQDGQAYIVSKNQFQNIKGNSVSGEAKEFAPELKMTEETIHSTPSQSEIDALLEDEVGQGMTRGDAIEFLMTNEEYLKTRYAQYQLPDGENYKEILIKAPVEEINSLEWEDIGNNSLRATVGNRTFGINKEGNRYYIFEKNGQLGKVFDGTLEEAKKEVLKNTDLTAGNTFKSSHWDEPNVISHLRMNERTYNGKKVSFLEELQSDWAREGRDKGFMFENSGSELRKLDEEMNDLIKKYPNQTRPKEIQDRLNYIGERMNELNDAVIPNNPLLKNWTETSVRRSLIEAVNSDADYFAWINGEQTSNRYNLATQIDNVSWNKINNEKLIDLTPNGGMNHIVVRIDEKGKIILTKDNAPADWKGKNLDEVIGKGLADKIMADATGNLSGDGLKFGGEWANNLYDKQIANIVKDLTGAKIEKLKMNLSIGSKEPEFIIDSGDYAGGRLSKSDLKVGLEIDRKNFGGYIITDVLEDGKFKAVRKTSRLNGLFEPDESLKKYLDIDSLEKRLTKKNPNNPKFVKDRIEARKKEIESVKETFDISIKKSPYQQGIELTPEIKARIKGEDLGFKTKGEKFEKVKSDQPKTKKGSEKLQTDSKLEKDISPEKKGVVAEEIPSKEIIPTEKEARQVKKGVEDFDKMPPAKKTITQTNEWSGKFELPDETKFEAFRRSVEDANIRLKVLNDKVEDVAGRKIGENLNLWAQKDMLPRKQSDILRRIREEKRDFVQELVKADIKVEELDEYLHARHAQERNAQMSKLRVEAGKDPVDGLSGMTDAEAQKILEKSGDKYKDFIKTIDEKNEKTLKFLLDEGMLKQEEYDTIKSTYDNYVPLFRDMEDDFTGIGIGQGVDIKGKEIRRAKGSKEKRVISPIGNVFYQEEKVRIRALKNEVGKTVIDLTKEFPETKELFEVEAQKYVPRYNSEGDLQFLDPKMKLGDNVIGTKIDGKQYFITIKDQRLAQALKNLNVARIPTGLKFMRSALGIWSSFKTRWRPEFLITNFQRDLGEALLNLGVEKTMLKGQGKGLRKDIVKDLFPSQKRVWKYLRGGDDTQVDEFFKLGGDAGHFWLEDVSKAEKSLLQLEKEIQNVGAERIKNPIRKIGQLADDINSMVELGVRYSTYKNLVARGLSKQQAIQSSADLTVNFSRQGEISPVLKSLWGFINPTIQGGSKVIRSLASKEGGKSVAKGVAFLTALGFFTRYMSMMVDEEGDEQISDWNKNHKLMFAIGNGKTINLWNMPYGFTAFYSLGSNMAELLAKKKTGREVLSNFYNTTVDSFSPFGTSINDLIPTMAKPIFDVNQNVGWYDGAIHPDPSAYSNTPKPNVNSYFASASDTAKFITAFMNDISGGDTEKEKAGLIDMHPDDLEYLFDQYFGGPFEFVQTSMEAGARGLNGEFEPNKTPFVRQVYREGYPQQFAYSVIYETLERSYKKELSDLEKNRFYRAIDIGLEEDVFDQKRADGYTKDFIKAQYKITGTITEDKNIEIISNMPEEDQTRLISTYAEGTQTKIEKEIGKEKKPEKKETGRMSLEEIFETPTKVEETRTPLEEIFK